MGRKRKNDSTPTTAKSDEPVQPTTKKLHQQQQQKLQQLLQQQQQEQEKLLQQQREAEEAERQKLKQLEEANNKKEKAEEEEEEEEEEEVEEEYEEEVEEEEEEEGEEEEEAPQGADLGNRNPNNEISSAAAANNINDHGEGYDGEEEPIEKLLEPFGKDKLINLLKEVASEHRDVADRIRSLADEDPVHRKIFVHGLGWDTTVETLLNAFSQYGEIEDCKAVIDKVTGKSKGYGFILFKRRRGAQKALEQPNKKIGNRMTACQLASVGPVPGPAAGPAAASASAAASAGAQQQTVVSEYTQRKIYVSNVGAELDPQKLYQFFSRFGEIEEGPLGLDKATGKPKGFCLFVYKTFESAKRALEEPHKSFEGHVLHCQRAIDGPKPGKNQQQQQQQQHHNAQNSQFQRNDNAYPAGHTTPPAPVMTPGAGAAIGFNQAAVNPAALNPALGQAISALLAAQPGLGFNLLGPFGTAAAMPAALPGMQGAFVNPANMNPGVMGSYPNQGAIPGGYNQQAGQSGSGRGQQGAGQYGAPYMGH